MEVPKTAPRVEGKSSGEEEQRKKSLLGGRSSPAQMLRGEKKLPLPIGQEGQLG